AEAGGTKPAFDQTFANRPDIVTGEQRLYQARQIELITHRNQADAVVAQIKTKIDSLTAKITSATKSLAVLKQQAAGLGELTEKGYYSRLQFQTTQRKVFDEEKDFNATKSDLVQAKKELDGAIEKRSA